MANYTESDRLAGLKVAILITDGFEQVEMTEPRKKLNNNGADTKIVSPKTGTRVRAWNFTNWGEDFHVDVGLHHADPDKFDALLLPGGVINPDTLRMDARAVDFVRAFFDAGKPVAVICHGPWTIIEADRARGRRMTSWPSLRTDLRNAGAEWVDVPVVVDGDQLVCSRQPDDIPEFNKAMVDVFAQRVPTHH